MDFSILQFSFILDTIPVFLALVALKGLYGVNQQHKILYLARTACVLLIICQITWIHSYLNNFAMINSLVDNLWTVFNSIVMVMIVFLSDYLKVSRGRRSTDRTSIDRGA